MVAYSLFCIWTWVTNLHSWCIINVLVLSQSDKCNFFMYIITSQREKIKEVLKISKTVVAQQKHTLCNQRTSQKTPLNSVTNSIQSTKLTCNINSLQMGKKVMMTAVIFLKSFSPTMHTNSKISTSACKIYKTTKEPSKDKNSQFMKWLGWISFWKTPKKPCLRLPFIHDISSLVLYILNYLGQLAIFSLES